MAGARRRILRVDSDTRGPIAQLVERLAGSQEVRGSNPRGSTSNVAGHMMLAALPEQGRLAGMQTISGCKGRQVIGCPCLESRDARQSQGMFCSMRTQWSSLGSVRAVRSRLWGGGHPEPAEAQAVRSCGGASPRSQVRVKAQVSSPSRSLGVRLRGFSDRGIRFSSTSSTSSTVASLMPIPSTVPPFHRTWLSAIPHTRRPVRRWSLGTSQPTIATEVPPRSTRRKPKPRRCGSSGRPGTAACSRQFGMPSFWAALRASAICARCALSAHHKSPTQTDGLRGRSGP